jgi:hypothetical protein
LGKVQKQKEEIYKKLEDFTNNFPLSYDANKNKAALNQAKSEAKSSLDGGNKTLKKTSHPHP